MKGHPIDDQGGAHDLFTDKQCQVLDLLIEHKTSKEIARILGISPYTVDQRISLARAKLGVSSRNDLAARYQEMVKARGQIILDQRPVSEPDHSASEHQSVGSKPSSIDKHDGSGDSDEEPRGNRLLVSADAPQVKNSCPTPGGREYRVGPELFEGGSGGLWRFGAIVATALLLVMTILVLFAVFDQLNALLA